MTEIRKVAVILRAGAKDYAVIMSMTSTMTQAAHTRTATAAENITEMHKQYCIGRNTIGSEERSKKIADNNDIVHETSLAEMGNSRQQCYGCGKVGHKRNNCPDKK